jgi:adenylate kinase
MFIVLLGPPASGKGTQGRALADSLGLSYLSTGALLRGAVEDGSELGKKAQPILDRGEYLPDELMCSIMVEWLASHASGWVLDGFPRTLDQAHFLQNWLAGRDESLDVAILLEVGIEELLRRIRGRVECGNCGWTGQRTQLNDGLCPKCGGHAEPRDDDNEQNFRSRHAEFESRTRPVADFYQSSGVLRRFDATLEAPVVAQNILKGIQHGQKEQDPH